MTHRNSEKTVTIASRQDLKNLFKHLDLKVFNLGVLAYDCTGMEDMLQSFEVIALRKTSDDDAIRKVTNLTVLEELIPIEILNSLKKNSVSLLRREEITNHIKKYENPLVLSYKGRSQFEELVEKLGYHNASAKGELNKLFENKSNFRKILEQLDLDRPKSMVYSADLVPEYPKIASQFGSSFVLQAKGVGTRFINTVDDYLEALNKLSNADIENNSIVVSEFITGTPVSISCIATRWGTFCSNLQYQVVGIPELLPIKEKDGVFCGHDWTASEEITKTANDRAINIGKRIGDYLYSKGYKGFFGIDYMLGNDGTSLYTLECNPRLTGVTPTIDHIQNELNKTTFMSLHILEFLPDFFRDIPLLDVNFSLLEQDIQSKKHGSHFFLTSSEIDSSTTNHNLMSGVYSVSGDNITYLKSGYRMKDMTDDNQFILVEMPSSLRTAPGGRIARVITRNSILGNDRSSLNAWSRNLVSVLYAKYTGKVRAT